MKQRSASWWAVVLCWCAITLMWAMDRPKNAFAWDSFAYHIYLPSVVQHHQVRLDDFGWVEDARVRYEASGTLYQLGTLPDGTRLVKVTYGLALLWLPGYLLGHAAALATDAPTDGYSMPYQVGVQLVMLLYVLIGLRWLRSALLMRFNDGVSAVVIALLVFGTNYLDQAVHGLCMPHVPLFSLYAGVLLFTMRWHRERTLRYALALALCMGLAALSRPSELVCVLIPLLWGCEGGLRSVFKAHVSVWKQWSVIAGILFLIALPQFLFWKHVTGHYVYNSYGNTGEGFDFLRPHTWDFLFSFRKGWFIYTPLMGLATAGLLLLRRMFAPAAWSIPVFFVLNLYVVSSWSCWWYADSFGSRAMIQSYPIMAVPLAALITRVLERPKATRTLFTSLVALFAILNLFQYWQFHKGIIHSSRMTQAAYVAGFGRLTAPADLEAKLRVFRSYGSEQGEPDLSRYRLTIPPTAFTTLPASDLDTMLTDSTTGSPLRMYRLDGDHPFTPGIRLPYKAITPLDHAWVIAQWTITTPSMDRAINGSFVMTFEHDGENYGYRAFDAGPLGAAAGATSIVRARLMTPEIRDTDDPLVLYFWSRDTVPVLVSDPRIEVYEPLFEP